MHQPGHLAYRVLHPLGDLQRQLDGDRKADRGITDPRPEIRPAPLFPADVLCDDVGQAAELLNLVRARDEGMLLQPHPDRCLGSKGIPHLGVGRVSILDGLQRTRKVQHVVERAVDNPHGAPVDRQHLVPVADPVANLPPLRGLRRPGLPHGGEQVLRPDPGRRWVEARRQGGAIDVRRNPRRRRIAHRPIKVSRDSSLFSARWWRFLAHGSGPPSKRL